MRKSISSIGRSTPEGGLRETSLQPILPAAAIALYTAWNARNLAGAWQHSPFDRCGSLAFIFWITPVVAAWWTVRPLRVCLGVCTLALAISFAGVATDLSVLEYAGLAVALASFLPFRPAFFGWLACAAAWMPAAGWAFSSQGAVLVNSMRVAAGIAAAALTPLLLNHESSD